MLRVIRRAFTTLSVPESCRHKERVRLRHMIWTGVSGLTRFRHCLYPSRVRDKLIEEEVNELRSNETCRRDISLKVRSPSPSTPPPPTSSPAFASLPHPNLLVTQSDRKRKASLPIKQLLGAYHPARYGYAIDIIREMGMKSTNVRETTR